MYEQIEKEKQNQRSDAIRAASQKKDQSKPIGGFVDKRHHADFGTVLQMTEEEALAFIQKTALNGKVYELIDHNLGAGNCHGYTYYNDTNESVAMKWFGSHLETYNERIPGQKITLFISDDEVQHSAKGHGAECIHKMGEGGPVVKCDAQVYKAAFGYENIYKLPNDLEAFSKRADEITAAREAFEINEKVLNTFLCICEMHKEVVPACDEAFWAVCNETPSQATTAKVEALKAKIGDAVKSWVLKDDD